MNPLVLALYFLPISTLLAEGNGICRNDSSLSSPIGLSAVVVDNKKLFKKIPSGEEKLHILQESHHEALKCGCLQKRRTSFVSGSACSPIMHLVKAINSNKVKQLPILAPKSSPSGKNKKELPFFLLSGRKATAGSPAPVLGSKAKLAIDSDGQAPYRWQKRRERRYVTRNQDKKGGAFFVIPPSKVKVAIDPSATYPYRWLKGRALRYVTGSEDQKWSSFFVIPSSQVELATDPDEKLPYRWLKGCELRHVTGSEDQKWSSFFVIPSSRVE